MMKADSMPHWGRWQVFVALGAALFICSRTVCLAGVATSAPADQLASGQLQPLPSGANALYKNLTRRIPARLKPWFAAEEAQLNASQATDFNWPSPNDPKIANETYTPADLAAMEVVVILMLVQDGDKDLQEQMLEAQAEMQAKQRLRALIQEMDQVDAQLQSEGYSATSSQPCPQPNCGTDVTGMSSLSAFIPNFVQPDPPKDRRSLRADKDYLERVLSELEHLIDARSAKLKTEVDHRGRLIRKLNGLMEQISGSEDSVLKNLK